MLESLDDPLATATVTWLTAEEGGRRSGPPTAPVYTTTATFRTGDAVERAPGWPASDPRTLSVLLQRIETEPRPTETMKVDFIAREEALPYLETGAEMVVLEGPRRVADAVIIEVFRPESPGRTSFSRPR